MAEKVVVDHGDRVLIAGDSGMGGIRLRLFTPAGYSDIALEVEELGPLIDVLKTAVAADAERRLSAKETTAVPNGSGR